MPVTIFFAFGLFIQGSPIFFHICNKNSIKWNLGVDVNDLKYDPILVTCFEGLIEEKHPYNFIAK